MECARPPSCLSSPADSIHYRRTHSKSTPDAIRLVLDGTDIVLFTAPTATGTDLPVLQANISTLENGIQYRSLHNFNPTKSCRTRTAATSALIAKKWIKRANDRPSHSTDNNGTGDGYKQSAGSAASSHGRDRDSSQQRSGPEQAGKGGSASDKDGTDNQGNGASNIGAGGGSSGNDDDDNRDGHRPRRTHHPDNDDEEDDSDEEQEGDDSQNEHQLTQDSIKADPDGDAINIRSEQEPASPEPTKDTTAIKEELVAAERDTDTNEVHPSSTSTPARKPLPSSAPRPGDVLSRAPSAAASVSLQTKSPTQITPKSSKTAQRPTQKTSQTPTVQTTSPHARRPQPPLFSESPTSNSPQDSRPQPRRPLPQARPVQLGTPLQSPIITVQNVDNNETSHPLPSQALQRSPHSKSPNRASPQQLSPHRAGRSPRRPLPQSRCGSRRSLSLSKPSPTSVEGLRIMPVATEFIEADPTDPCTANNLATFDMFWERALEELRRDKKQAAGPQQQDRAPVRSAPAKQQALPGPISNQESRIPMGDDEQPADTHTHDAQTQPRQQHPRRKHQRQLHPRMHPRAQPSIQPQLQPNTQPQMEESMANYQHTGQQFIVHIGPGLAVPPAERRKHSREESAEIETAKKRAKEERQRERMERQMIEEEENRRQRLQLHQQRIQQQVLKQQMHEQEVSLRRQQQEQQQRDLEQHEQSQELQRQLAEQFKQQQLLEEERQKQIGDMDYYKRYLDRKPPLQMLSELEEAERKQRGEQQQKHHQEQNDMRIEQPFEEGIRQHNDPPQQPVSCPWPLERPGPLLKQSILANTARPTARSIRPSRPIYSRPIRPAGSAHPVDSARPVRSIHIAPQSSITASITQPLHLIATREGTVMSVDDYRDAHKRAVIEAREHLRRLEETDPLLPIERPDLIARRCLPSAPPAPAPCTVATTGVSATPRSLKNGVAPCPCCNQYLKGYRGEGAHAAGEAAPRSV